MIKEKKVVIKCGSAVMKHYRDLGYNVEKMNQMLTVAVEHLPKGSHVDITAICEYCSKKSIIRYHKYVENVERGGYYSCISCSRDKAKETSKERYGEDNYSKTEEYKKRVIETNLEKYGCEYISQSPIIKEKAKQTNLEKYGTEYALSSKEVIEKRYKTMEEKYGKGVKTYMQSDEYKQMLPDIWLNKTLPNFLDRYKLNDIYISGDYETDTITLKCDKCSENYSITRKNYTQRIDLYNMTPCTLCVPLVSHKGSYGENLLYEFAKNNTKYDVIKYRVKNKELDIYIEKLNIAFEFNGLFWHSMERKNDKLFHYNKFTYFKSQGIHIYNIWEDDFDINPDIVYAFIKRELNVNKKHKIKDYKIETLDNETINNFLIKNELRIKKFTHNISLVNNNTIDAVLTYTVSNTIQIQNITLSNDNINYNTISLLTEHIKQLYPNIDIQYKVDKSYTNLNILESFNFELIKETKADKHIINENFSKDRFVVYNNGSYNFKLK